MKLGNGTSPKSSDVLKNQKKKKKKKKKKVRYCFVFVFQILFGALFFFVQLHGFDIDLITV